MGNVESRDKLRISENGNSPKLKKADLLFLKENTTFDEATISEWYTEFLRDCKNGKLSPEKFKEVYKAMCPNGEAEAFAQHVFRTFDKDKNGFIDFKEFLMAVNVTSSGTVEQKLKWAFSMVDIDGNGHIDLHEMTRVIGAIQDMSAALSDKRPPNSPVPTDAPGNQANMSGRERAQLIFTQMDTNHDGILDEKEFMTGCMNDSSLVNMLMSTGRLG